MLISMLSVTCLWKGRLEQLVHAGPVRGFNANLKFTTDGADESDDMLKKDVSHGAAMSCGDRGSAGRIPPRNKWPKWPFSFGNPLESEMMF